jgi:carbon storage regulator
MLVLARKVGQRVYLGHDIVVTVLAANRQSVRLGIEAPASVHVWREELLPVERSALPGPPEKSPDARNGTTFA